MRLRTKKPKCQCLDWLQLNLDPQGPGAGVPGQQWTGQCCVAAILPVGVWQELGLSFNRSKEWPVLVNHKVGFKNYRY